MDFDTLVLSGGGVKCIATLGALQYMYDQGFGRGVAKYVGTSAGAMISFLLAIGYTPIEIMVYICTHQVSESLLPLDLIALLTGKGAIQFDRLDVHLRDMTRAKIGRESITMYELHAEFGKVLVCTTYNLTTNEAEYISHETRPDIDCLLAVRMSSSLPVVFNDCEYEGCVFLDGGVVDNFPIIATSSNDRVFGCLVQTKYTRLGEQNRLLSLLRIAVTISSSFYVERCLAAYEPECTVLRIHVEDTDVFAFDQTSSTRLDLFSHGYNTCSTFFKSCAK